MRRLFLLGALALSACVRSHTAMIDDRTAVISAHGTAFDDTAGVLKKVLMEAAAQAQARGFEYFQVVGAKDASRQGVFNNPGSTNSSYVGSMTCSAVTCAGSAVGSSSSSPGYAYSFIKPGADVAVRFLHPSEVTANMDGVFSVASVLAAR